MKEWTLLTFLSVFSLSAFAQGNIKIYDANKMLGLGAITKKGKLVITDGKPAVRNVSPNALLLAEQFKKIQSYFTQNHNRNSWDGKGADIEATVNIRGIIGLLGLKQNAAWLGDTANREENGDIPAGSAAGLEGLDNRFLFGKGSRNGLDNFEKALDVIGHEYTHAVIETSSNLRYKGQSGALNEHLADVFGVLINRQFNQPKNPYLIGAIVLPSTAKAEALRDMEYPEKGLVKQPGHMDDLKKEIYKKYGPDCVAAKQNDFCGVHILSGIPNRMATVVLKSVSTEEATVLFYNVMTKRLSRDSQFADYKKALREECVQVSSQTCDAVERGLELVGL